MGESRQQAFVLELKTLLGDLAGQDLASADPSSSFVELGFDSLFLTQAAMLMKNKFGVKVTFRSLLEDLTSISALAAHLDARVPADKPIGTSHQVPAAVAPPPGHSPSPAANESAAIARRAEEIQASDLSSNGELPAAAGSMTSTVLDRVIKEQLRIMEQQLALLRKSTPGRFNVPVPPASNGSGPAPVVVPSPSAAPASASSSSSSPGVTPANTPPPAAAPAPMAQHGPFRQLDKGQRGGLTAEQQAHLDWLIPRYVSKTPKSKAYTQRHRASFADPRAVAGFKQNWKEMVYPIVSTRSAGANIWDLDGNQWVDVTMGFGVALLGHSPAFITEVVKKQLDLGVEIGPQSPLAGEVAELICEFTGMERVTFCNTGSEAVMAALRICRTVTGRTKVVVFAGAYHGTFDEVLVKGAWMNGEPKTLAIAPGVAPNLISSVVVLEYGTPQTLEWIRKNSEDLAAVLVETVQSRHPDLQPKEFLQEVRKITQATETPLIFDEVITGFRCHPGGAQKYFGIEADLATYGKIIGGGMPFGFIAGKSYLMDAFDGGCWQYGDDSFPPTGVTFFAGTFVRHPLAMAAAKAMLLRLKEEGPALQENLGRRTTRMLGELNQYFERNQIPLHLEHFTSVWYPHFGSEVKYGSLLYFHLREKGLHIWEGRPCFLSTAHTAEDEAFIIRAFKLSVAEMQAGGFLPGTSDAEFVAEARTRLGLPEAAVARSLAPAATSASSSANRVPLTEGQKEMWFSAQMDPQASGTFNASAVVDLHGPLQPDVLERAIGLVVARHEALRATFSEDGQWLDIGELRPAVVARHDLSTLAPAARAAKASEIIARDGSNLFDFLKGPLYSFSLIRHAADHHVLVFTVNMIVCDGWGYNVILEETGAAYSALVQGRQVSFRPAVPMRDYVEWLAQPEQKETALEAERYWKERFKKVPAPLDLPSPSARPSSRSCEGSRHSLRLSAEFYHQIKATAKTLGQTPFSLFLAAYQTWIHRLTGATDFVIGVPYAGQSGIGTDVVGQCVHTLPLRFELDPKRPFSELLRSTRDQVLDAQEHWNCTFGSIAQQLELPRDASRLPLVSVLFNLDPPMSKVAFHGLRHHIEAGPRFYFQYDLGFNLVDEGETLLIECDFNTRLLDSGWVKHWLTSYQTLLESVVRDAAQSVGTLSLMTESELRKTLTEASGEVVALDRSVTIHSQFVAQAARTPEAVAVEFQGSKLSYAELDRRSNQLAHYLQSKGVGRDTFVALALERSLELVVALLGVLKAGAAYVPIDTSFPKARIEALLADCSPVLIITDSASTKNLPELRSPWIRVDEEASTIRGQKTSAPAVTSSGEDLAYLIYTSGSTGSPKGVQIEHRSVVNLLNSMQRSPGAKASDVFLGITNLSFDIAAVELFLPLALGARVVLLARETVLDPQLLSGAIRDSGATVVQATPSTWRTLVNQGWKGSPKLKLLCGGETLSSELAEKLLLCCGSLWNLYGPTETTIWTSVAQVKAGAPVTLGRPILNSKLQVLSPLLQPVPVGATGEIYVSGVGLARGYHKLSDLTRSRFVLGPASAATNPELLYRTGDLGRLLPSGEIEFLGRSDFQLKISGCRVEPREIELVLLGHPQVGEVVVVSREEASGVPVLVAFLTSKAGTSSSVSQELIQELRKLARTKLPEYMVPSSFIVLESLPKSATGKIDRAALPSLQLQTVSSGAGYVAPRNETEEKLAALWCEILKVKQVGVHDNFFDLGGQSLRAVALFGRLEKEFGKKLPLATLFRSPTLEQLAAALSGNHAEASKAWASLVPIQPKGNGAPLFLVHGAGGNVLLYQALARYMAPDFPLYGLQSQGLDGVVKPLRTVEQMAALYLKEIRSVQPKGPYYLGGYCLGGTIAYEMAQRLRAEGEEVPLVAMLDTYNFPLMLKVNPAKYLLQKLRFHLGNFMKLSPGEMGKYIKEKLRVARDGEWANLLGGEGVAEANSEAGGVGAAIQASVQAINDRASLTYKPQPYSGKLTLFKPQVNYDFYPDPQMGWGGLVTGGIAIVEMPVNPHAMLVEPYVQTLARELKDRMLASPRVVEVPQAAPAVPDMRLGTQVA